MYNVYINITKVGETLHDEKVININEAINMDVKYDVMPLSTAIHRL